MRRTIFHLFSTVALAACGGGGSYEGNGGDAVDITNGARPAANSEAAAQGTAAAQGINCGSLRRGEGPDVVGVSIGMAADDAFAAIACSNPALRVEFSEQGGFRLPPLPDGRRPRTAIIGRGDGETIEALLVGLPGQERIVAVRRDIRFADGQQPQVSELEQQLRGKYGALETDPQQLTALRLTQTRVLGDTRGAAGPCAPSTHGSLSLYQNCGLGISAYVGRDRGNPMLTGRLIVAVNDGAFGHRLMAEYAAHAQGATRQNNIEEAEQAAGRTPEL